MTTRIIALSLAVALFAAAAPAAAQQKPPLSPPGQAAVTIGAATITIDYARPSMRGRKIMGELVPYDKVWRTGANAATTLKTSPPLRSAAHWCCRHVHAVHAARREGVEAHHQQEDRPVGHAVRPGEDLARVDLKVAATAAPVEQFTITLAARARGRPADDGVGDDEADRAVHGQVAVSAETGRGPLARAPAARSSACFIGREAIASR